MIASLFAERAGGGVSLGELLDRARLRQANRLYGQRGTPLNREALMTIEPEDLRASRVFDLPDPPTEVTS